MKVNDKPPFTKKLYKSNQNQIKLEKIWMQCLYKTLYILIILRILGV